MMFGWFKKKMKSRTAYEAITHKLATKTQCPCCERDDAFLAGPEGGMSQNIMCEFCGTRLNMTVLFGESIILDWTHGPQANIWGGRAATEFPNPKAVALVEIILGRK